MSRFTDELYRGWLRQNGQGVPRHSRGMGQRPMSSLPRQEGPTAEGAAPPGRPRQIGAGAVNAPALAGPQHTPALPPRGAGDNAEPPSPARHDKQAVYGDQSKKDTAALFLTSNEDYYLGGSR